MKGFLIGLGIILVLAVSIGLWVMAVSNNEIMTRNRGDAQEEVCSAFFDKMWKVLQQQAQVTDEYKESFKEIYIPLIEGRYSQGDGSLMKWITEHNPQFDASLYKGLMASIEGQREGFFMEQQKLIDIDRQHKDMRMTFPNKLIIGSRPDLDIVIIKSLKTKDAYESGEENDVDLFQRD